MTAAPSARREPAPTLAGLADDFEGAARAAGGASDLHLAIAGGHVHVRFAGARATEALSPAFAHLARSDGASPALTLHVWDSETAGTARPAFAPPRAADAEASNDGTGASHFYEEAGFRALHQSASDSLSVLSKDGRTGWFWVPDAAALPYWDYTAPFRHLLSWWLAERGCRHVHGGAVGTEEGGVLLVGRGGSGKSTSSLASLSHDRLRYAGDDYVAVGGDGTPHVHSLYCSGKVHHHDLHRLPHLAPALANRDRDDEKAVFYVASSFPGRTIAGFPLRAIVLPRVTERRAARAVPATHAAALAALAPSTIFQLHPPAREALAQMAELVRTVPTFALELGSDVETIPDELERLLAEVA